MNKLLNISVITLSTVLLVGCGSGSSSPVSENTNLNNNENTTASGYLIDSPIAGVNYSCNGKASATPTDAQGAFECTSLPVIFSVGTLTIGQINEFTADKKVYPQDLLGLSRTNFTDSKLIALTRFLQSLDDDGNYEELINITKATSDKFSNYGVLFRASELDEYIAKAEVVLVNEESAIMHLQKNMADSDKPVEPSQQSLVFDKAFLGASDASRYYVITCSQEVNRWGDEVAHFDLEERNYTPNSINGIVDENLEVTTFDKKLFVTYGNGISMDYGVIESTKQGNVVIANSYYNSTRVKFTGELWYQVGYQFPGSSDSRQGHCATSDWRDIDQIHDVWYNTRGGENLWSQAEHNLVGASCQDYNLLLFELLEILQLEVIEQTKDSECGVYTLDQYISQ
jgi:hypothetical protein